MSITEAAYLTREYKEKALTIYGYWKSAIAKHALFRILTPILLAVQINKITTCENHPISI